jgi:5'-nucleotidase
MVLQPIPHDPVLNGGMSGSEGHIEPEHRIYVNRNLRMRTIRMIGFDMDYTLALYDKVVLENLAFEATRAKLIVELHYPEAIAGLRYDPECVIRGLVVDKRLGNVLKIDQYGYVTRAYHGLRLIPSETRKTMYRNSRIRLSSDRYKSIDTLFGLPEATLFLQLVDHFELVQKTPWKDYTRVYDDVRACIDRAHADDTIKKEIVANLSRFVVKDPQLPAALAAFRAQGKKLFLLTNSEAYYTQVVMHYLLSGALEAYRSWRDYFDIVVVSASKPDFYRGERPFTPLTPEQMTQAGLDPSAYPVHTGGSARHLEDLGGHRGDEVLYVGDHTFGDILRAKKRPGWRTAMLIEELHREIELDRALGPEFQAVEAEVVRRNQVIREVSRLQRRLQQLQRQIEDADGASAEQARLSEQRATLQAHIQGLQDDVQAGGNAIRTRKAELDARYNPHWGKLFKCGDINSRFGQQVKDFACIYTSAVSNFAAYPESTYFRSTREVMPHEMERNGF